MKKGPLISNVQYAKIIYEGLRPACTFMVKQTKKIIKYKIADCYLHSLQEIFLVISPLPVRLCFYAWELKEFMSQNYYQYTGN